MKVNSWVWDYYHLIHDFGEYSGHNNYKAFNKNDPKSPKWASCNLCGRILVAYSNKSKGWSASSIQGHLTRSHKLEDPKKNQSGDDNTQKLSVMFRAQTTKGVPTFKNPAERKDYLLGLTCRWIAATNNPLSAVEKPEFRNMIRGFDKYAPLFTRDNVKEKLKTMDSSIHAMVVNKPTKGCFVSFNY